DGKFIEKIGTYNPLTVPATIELNHDRAMQWLYNGAQPTDTVRSILRFKGVLLYKHLLEGVKKGAFTQEEADAKFHAWVAKKDETNDKRRAKVSEAKEKFKTAVDGVAKVKAKPVVEEAPAEETAAEEATEAATEEAAEAAPEAAAEENTEA
ncbi:MAG: 30S ribosomal protein S16, partial [Saprospiraceae bacterium]|nr:30S ribosomal protein S16 [Saprospiraceae bacterium]